MARLGVHFVLTDEQRAKLLSLESDEARLDYLQEDIEQAWDESNVYETDKAWYGIHRCLTGPQAWEWPDVDDEAGTYPLNVCFFGGKALYSKPESAINLIEPDALHDLVVAIAPLDRAWFDKAFADYCQGCWPDDGDDGREYVWEYFTGLKNFLTQNDGKGRSLIFSINF